MKKVRTSYSQNSTYKDCSKHWYWKYVEKLVPIEDGASLFFGSAVDDSVMALLEGQENYMEIFHSKWHTHLGRKNESIQIYDSENVLYGYNDFDSDVLQEEDLQNLTELAASLKLPSGPPVEVYQEIVKVKKNKFKKMSKAQKSFFLRANWLSLNRKGPILIESFKEQFMPKIKRVLSTQRFGRVTDPQTGDAIVGALDFVAELEGYDKPIILDLKTAGRPYTQDNIDFSEQLPLYAAMFNKDYDTNLVGYVVLVKNINKNRVGVCKSCGYKKSTSHKTCDNEIDGKRCKGEWDETVEIAPEVQTMITTVPDEKIHNLLNDYGNIIEAMRQEIVYKNTSKCTNWYGGLCPYFKLCHEGSHEGLKKK